MDNEIVTALDIGTSKVCALIGQRSDDDELIILGVGESQAEGVRKGVIVNIDSTVKAIRHAIEDAELMAGIEVESVYTGIAGSHIKGQNSRGVVAVSSKDREISNREIERVIEAAQALNIPSERQILHVIPWEFTVDGQDGIKDPTGMTGVRLESDVHLVTGSTTSTQNIVKSIQKSGLNIRDIILEPLAASEAVLGEDEKEIGTLLIDIGAYTTSVVFVLGGSIRYTNILSLGSKNVTKDLAIILRTPDSWADAIKKQHGCAMIDLVPENEVIEIPSLSGNQIREIPRKDLARIIEPRMEEIFALINHDIEKNSIVDLVSSGIVLTGGGSMLEGCVELAERVFELPVRVGSPKLVQGLAEKIDSPAYATAVGLCLRGLQELKGYAYQTEHTSNRTVHSHEDSLMQRWKDKITELAKDFFS